MESAVSSLSSDLGQLGPSTTAREKSSTSTAAGCQGCENLRKNLLNVANQLSYMGQLQVQHSEGQKAVQQMTEQMAKHNIYVETLTDQIYNMKNQLRTAEMESETAKRREVEIQKHLDVLEQASAALRKKADTADMYENRYERAVAVCDVLQRKRLMISENLKALTDFAKKSKLDAESSKQDCERIKADKMAAMDKIRMYKKHVPNMLKVIDELAKRADSMPIHTRRKIDSLSSKEIRLQLLGEHALTMSQEESVHEEEDADSSDDDMADDLETLIAGGVHASIRERSPVKARVAKKSPVKWRGLSESPKKTRELTESPMKERVQPRGESVRRGRGGWRGARRGATAGGHHNVDEAEKAFSAKLLSKLSKIEPTQPLSEVSGGHSTIHGKRGPTVREQQAKMMSVAEKVAMLRKEQDEPKKKAPEESLHAQQHTSKESTTSSSSDESSSPRRTRRKTPDWHSDLRLTPSPARLSPAHSLEALDNEQLLTTSEKPAFEELPPAPSVEAAPVEKVDGADHAKPAARASTAATSKSLTSQLNQKSMAINRRLRAAANRPLPVAVAVKKAAPKERIPAEKEDKKKIAEEGIQPDDEPGTSTVETKRIARGRKESTEKISHPEMASSEEKAPKRAVTVRRTLSAKSLTVEAAPVPKTTRQLKRKAAAEILPPKKLCLTASSAETLLKKVLDMDCAVEVLTKKIPAEELEQIKTIDAETFAAILMEHVLKMKSVDMWILVRNSCKKKSVDMLANKTEENLLQVAYTLSSTEGNVFRSFVRNLLFKIVSFPTLDALLCHRIVRLVAMVCVAQTQIREESEKDTAKEESRQQLEQLVKFLATKEPHLLGKSLVYLVNRLPAEYIHFLTQDDCTDVLRLVILYSDDEVCRNLQAYWHAKLNSDLPLQKREEISAWVKENLAFGSISGGGTELLQELFQFRSVYFTTPKTFSIALSESVDLLRLLESIFNTYKGDRPTDDIVASIFGGKSQKRLEDPDKVVIDELSERISTVIPLFDVVYRAESTIGRDRMRSFFRNLGSGVEMAHEILSLLSGREDAAENRKLLVSTLSEFLRSCQPISRHKLL